MGEVLLERKANKHLPRSQEMKSMPRKGKDKLKPIDSVGYTRLSCAAACVAYYQLDVWQ